MTSTVVGYKQFKSKKGTDCNVLILLTTFTRLKMPVEVTDRERRKFF